MNDASANVLPFPANHHAIRTVIAQEIPDPEQRANVAVAILNGLPAELRRAAIAQLNTEPCDPPPPE